MLSLVSGGLLYSGYQELRGEGMGWPESHHSAANAASGDTSLHTPATGAKAAGRQHSWRVSECQAAHCKEEADLTSIMKGDLHLYHGNQCMCTHVNQVTPWPVTGAAQVMWLLTRCRGKRCVLLPKAFTPNLTIRRQPGKSRLWDLQGDWSASGKTKAGTVLDSGGQPGGMPDSYLDSDFKRKGHEGHFGDS